MAAPHNIRGFLGTLVIFIRPIVGRYQLLKYKLNTRSHLPATMPGADAGRRNIEPEPLATCLK